MRGNRGNEVTDGRPLAVRQILTCLQREHCHGNGGCPYQGRCNGGPAESLGVTHALIAYIEELEREACSCEAGCSCVPRNEIAFRERST